MNEHKKISTVDLVYENCDSHTLTLDMFDGLLIEGITRAHWINCYQYIDGTDCEYLRCNWFEITITNKGLASVMDRDYDMNRTLYDRLASYPGDITHVHLHFTDGSEEYISVPWGDDEMVNEFQKVSFTNDGEAEIKIIRPGYEYI